jgi:hypothetical protein
MNPEQQQAASLAELDRAERNARAFLRMLRARRAAGRVTFHAHAIPGERRSTVTSPSISRRRNRAVRRAAERVAS